MVKNLCFEVLWKFRVKDITKLSKCHPSELDSSGDLRSLTVLIEGYSLSKVHVLVHDFNFTVVVKINILDIIFVFAAFLCRPQFFAALFNSCSMVFKSSILSARSTMSSAGYLVVRH